MNTREKIIILVITIFAVVLTSTVGWSAELPFGKSFHYIILLDGEEIGIFVLTFGEPREEDGKQVLDISRLQTFDSMPGLPPGSKVTEKVTIELEDMKPILYLIDQDVKIQQVKVTYEFDYKTGKIFITQQMGENKITVEEELGEGIVDSITADILPLTRELEESKEYTIKVVGMGPTTYKFIGEETISTPAGDFAAMKWEFDSFNVKGTNWYSLDEPYILQSISETVRGTMETKLERIEVGEKVAEIAPLERAEEEEEEIIPEGYTAKEVTFTSDGVTLAGTLTIPEGEILPPGVILIHGSGPVDRDENVPGGLKLNVFAEIADALSKAGFAVLRYDKRGIGESTGNYSKATLTDLVNDVQAAVRFMRSQPGIDMNRIALVGHSEGGIIAPIVSARDPMIKAIVLMAGTARPLDEVVEDQVRYAYAISGIDDEKLIQEGIELQKEMLEAIREGEDTLNDQPIPLAAWWREHINHNPLETIVQVNADVLILQGEKDFQVLVDKDAKMLAQALNEAGKPHKIAIFPNLDHLFKYVEGESTVASYLDTSRKVSEDVLNTMIEWLKETLK